MSGVSPYVVIAVAVVMTAAWLYHAVTEHHYHLVLLHVIRSSTVVPPATHDTRWHAMSHPRRLLVDALLIGAAILAGLAWELSPYMVAVLAVIAGIIFTGWTIIRVLDRKNEVRRPGKVTEGNRS